MGGAGRRNLRQKDRRVLPQRTRRAQRKERGPWKRGFEALLLKPIRRKRGPVNPKNQHPLHRKPDPKNPLGNSKNRKTHPVDRRINIRRKHRDQQSDQEPTGDRAGSAKKNSRAAENLSQSTDENQWAGPREERRHDREIDAGRAKMVDAGHDEKKGEEDAGCLFAAHCEYRVLRSFMIALNCKSGEGFETNARSAKMNPLRG